GQTGPRLVVRPPPTQGGMRPVVLAVGRGCRRAGRSPDLAQFSRESLQPRLVGLKVKILDAGDGAAADLLVEIGSPGRRGTQLDPQESITMLEIIRDLVEREIERGARGLQGEIIRRQLDDAE